MHNFRMSERIQVVRGAQLGATLQVQANFRTQTRSLHKDAQRKRVQAGRLDLLVSTAIFSLRFTLVLYIKE